MNASRPRGILSRRGCRGLDGDVCRMQEGKREHEDVDYAGGGGDGVVAPPPPLQERLVGVEVAEGAVMGR